MLLDSVKFEAQQHFHRIQVLPIVVLYLNNICDSRCKTCSIWKNNEWLKIPGERQMTDALLDELYKTLPGWRPRQILLSGGEPVIHPRFADTVRKFKEIAGKVCVITNGLLLNSCEATALEAVDEFYISFDAPDPDTYEKIRGVDGFVRLEASLNLLKKGTHQRPRIVARCTLQRDNVRRVPELITAARKFGFDWISFLAVDITSQAFSRDQHGLPDARDIRPSVEDLQIMETDLVSLDCDDHFVEGGAGRLRRILQYFRALIGEDDFPSVRCNAPWTSVVIETTGKIRGCFFHAVIGDFRNINGEAAIDFRRRLNISADPTCRRCVCSKFVGPHDFIRM